MKSIMKYCISVCLLAFLISCEPKKESPPATTQGNNQDVDTADAEFNKEIPLKATEDIGVSIGVSVVNDSANAMALQTREYSSALKSGETGTFECAVKVDVSKNWLTVTYPNGYTQTFTFRNQRAGDNYLIDFSVQTSLRYDQYLLTDYYYVPLSGAIREQAKLATPCTDYYNVRYSIRTKSKKLTGKFVIIYKSR